MGSRPLCWSAGRWGVGRAGPAAPRCSARGHRGFAAARKPQVAGPAAGRMWRPPFLRTTRRSAPAGRFRRRRGAASSRRTRCREEASDQPAGPAGACAAGSESPPIALGAARRGKKPPRAPVRRACRPQSAILGRAQVSRDDINDMPFTNLLSAQIAEW